MKLGFAVLGAGLVGRMRAEVISRHPHTELIGVADLDLDAARKASGRSGIAVSSYTELLEHPGVEAVIVATPTHLHHDMVGAALRAGKHVLCEKPLAPTLEQCRELVELAKSRKRTLAVGFNHRYYPCIKDLRRALSDGTVGQVQHVRALCGHQGLSQFRADWNYQLAFSGGGAMMDLGIHLTDLVGHLFGTVETVYGTTSNKLWEVEGSEDHAAAMMTTERGIPVSYHATWGEWKGYRLILEVYGSEAVARAFYAPMVNLIAPKAEGRPPLRWCLHPWVNVREKLFGWETTATLAFRDELDDFLQTLNGKETLLACGQAGLAAVAVAQAVYQSRRTGEAVKVASLS